MEVWKTYAFRIKDPDTINHYLWIRGKYEWPWDKMKYRYYRGDSWWHESNRYSEIEPLRQQGYNL